MQRIAGKAWWWVALGCGLFVGCGDPRSPRGAGSGSESSKGQIPTGPLRDEIAPDQLTQVINAHYRGLGAMERFEYKAAAQAFREVQDRAPGWITGAVNLGIALLNQGGEAAENAKNSGREGPDEGAVQNIETARRIFDQVLGRAPNNPYALFSRGIILGSQGDTAAAHRDFARVTEIDPHDAHSWFEYGLTLTDPDRPWMPAGPKQAPELINAYTKALEANPYLVNAMYNLQLACRMAGEGERSARLLTDWYRLNPQRNAAGSGELAATIYGEMGKYALIHDPFERPQAPISAPPPPRFEALEAIDVKLAAGDRWAGSGDFVGRHAVIGRVQSRFGAGVASFDVNRDGRLDLYLTAAVVGPQGLRDVLLVNQGNREFADQTAVYGLPLDRAGLGVAASDFDADFQVDLYLTGINDNRLYRQEGAKFLDVTRQAGVQVEGAVSLTARWLDIDQDGDLDLYVVNHAPSDDLDSVLTQTKPGSGMANAVFRNDGRPAPVGVRPEDNWAPLAAATSDLPARQGLSIAFSTAWPAVEALQGGAGRHTALAALDIDDDRDFDLVLTADDQPATVLLNDRAGRFHPVPLAGWEPAAAINGVLVLDVDKDGHTDLVGTSTGGRVFAWRNATTRVGSTARVKGESFPIRAHGWRSAVAIDADLDTWHDLVGLPASDATTGIEWARNAATRFENRPLALGPMVNPGGPITGFTAADLVGDPLPDLLIRREGEAPRMARNLGNGSHWLGIDLSGRWKTSHDQMRTNSDGIGARIALEGQGLYVPFDATTTEAGTAQSLGPIVLGLGNQLNVPLLQTRWPDGVLQAELNVTADKVIQLVELSRKTGSCPILFTWNGTKFTCIGDFAGAAGLGFLETLDEYHPPDRDEALAIAASQLQAVGETFRLSVVEPMDEVAYLDQLSLDVVDRPPEVESTPDERFAFGPSHPTGDLIAWTQVAHPLAATDQVGRDVLPLIQHADRRSVDQFNRINGWVGFTADHALTLDFGDQLARLGPAVEPVLCLTGWVEYPYSQTNYAAATGGVGLQPPVLEQRLAGGEWRVIDPSMGHPAGLTRMMTVDLKGKLLNEPTTGLRIRTNMQCYWDQAFVAIRDPGSLARVRTARLPVARARLRDRGYLREFSPDGLKPALPDYDHVDPIPLARLQGNLTRHGDVAPLLRTDDDQLCVMGPGDEVQLEFDARSVPPLGPGWTRSFVFRSVAYCKDADPFTATSDTVGPLPWRGMKSFPFPPGGDRPVDPDYAAYLRAYQTRLAGER